MVDSITSSPKIVAYEPELKSSTLTSVVFALTVKSFSSDRTNLVTRRGGRRKNVYSSVKLLLSPSS